MVYIHECIDVNTALKKFLQIYELFVKDPSMINQILRNFLRHRLYHDIFFQIYEPTSVPSTRAKPFLQDKPIESCLTQISLERTPKNFFCRDN